MQPETHRVSDRRPLGDLWRRGVSQLARAQPGADQPLRCAQSRTCGVDDGHSELRADLLVDVKESQRHTAELEHIGACPASTADPRHAPERWSTRRPLSRVRSSVGEVITVRLGPLPTTRPHHHQSVGDPSRRADVVADHQHGQSLFLAQLRDEVQDLGLDGEIQGAGRFADEQRLSPQGQCERDGDALQIGRPDIWCGQRPGAVDGSSTLANAASMRSCWSERDFTPWSASVPGNAVPTLSTRLKAVDGVCRIGAIRRPRISRITDSRAPTGSTPSRRILPVTCASRWPDNPGSATTVIDLPEPDSPAIPTISLDDTCSSGTYATVGTRVAEPQRLGHGPPRCGDARRPGVRSGPQFAV